MQGYPGKLPKYQSSFGREWLYRLMVANGLRRFSMAHRLHILQPILEQPGHLTASLVAIMDVLLLQRTDASWQSPRMGWFTRRNRFQPRRFKSLSQTTLPPPLHGSFLRWIWCWRKISTWRLLTGMRFLGRQES